MNATVNKVLFADQFPLFDVLTEDEKYRLEEMVEFKVKPKYSFIYLTR